MEPYISFYIDESGSMTLNHAVTNPYFIICMVKFNETSKVKKLYKKLYVNHNEYFSKAADGREEIKGSGLTKNEKIFLANYFNRPNLIEVYYIKVSNYMLENNTIYQNSALAFNYFLCKDFSYLIKNNYVDNEDIHLNIDNRNVSNLHLKSLEDYLNISLSFQKDYTKRFTVKYYDSKNSYLIQISDFFANLFYSQLRTSNYTPIFRKLIDNKIIKNIYSFPPTISNNLDLRNSQTRLDMAWRVSLYLFLSPGKCRNSGIVYIAIHAKSALKLRRFLSA